MSVDVTIFRGIMAIIRDDGIKILETARLI